MSRRNHGNALPAGYRLRDYRIESILGQGGFGITYLAYDLALERQVALKEYLPVELAVREQDSTVRPLTEDRAKLYSWGLERFIREARTLAGLVHPNIVQIHTVFEHNATAYMVMAYEDGRSLADLIKFGAPRSEEQLLNISAALIDALQHVHDAGFLHRDIKPDNIYIRADGTPVLLDFGSARATQGTQARTKLTSVVSQGYAPYEQYHGDASRQGPWTDIYGFGATLYSAISNGRAPTDSLMRSDAFIGARADPYVAARAVASGNWSPQLLLAIDAALAFKPEDRPRDLRAWREMFPATDGTSPGDTPYDPVEAPTVRPDSSQTKWPAGSSVSIAGMLPDEDAVSKPPTEFGEGFGHGEPEPASRYLALGLLSFWIWTVVVLSRRVLAHTSDRERWFRSLLGERGADPAAQTLLRDGFSPQEWPWKFCALVYAGVALLVLFGFFGFIVLGVDWTPAAKVAGVGLSSLLFYASTVAFVTWLWRYIKRHEHCELKLLEFVCADQPFAPKRPVRGFTARWAPVDSHVSLFLVMAAPLAFSPTVAMYLFHEGLSLGVTLLLPLAVFVCGAIFHLWGTYVLIRLWNHHLAEELTASRRGASIVGLSD